MHRHQGRMQYEQVVENAQFVASDRPSICLRLPADSIYLRAWAVKVAGFAVWKFKKRLGACLNASD